MWARVTEAPLSFLEPSEVDTRYGVTKDPTPLMPSLESQWGLLKRGMGRKPSLSDSGPILSTESPVSFLFQAPRNLPGKHGSCKRMCVCAEREKILNWSLSPPLQLQ